MSKMGLTFTTREFQVCTIANMIEGDKSYWVAIGGAPLLAILLANKLHAPNVLYIIEDGTISPQPPQYPQFVTAAGAHRVQRAVAWKDMSTIDFHAALGYYDYGIINALQVDEYGNVNSSMLGNDFEHPQRRFGGPGGANELASMCWRTIIMADQEKRRFPKKVDFISSPGYLDGSPQARERAGLPRDTGPYRVVSDSAIFGFDEATRRMKLLAVASWTSVDEVLSGMGFEPVVAAKVGMMELPTEEQLALLRAELDPRGILISQGNWIEV